MALLQCTKKLLAELPTPATQSLSVPSILGDWHANLFRIERRKCVLFTHDDTLFSVFVPMLKKPHFQNLASVFVNHLIRTLESEGFKDDIIVHIKDDYTHNLFYTPTNSRSVLGSMNDILLQIPFVLARKGGLQTTNALDLNHTLNRTPLIKKSFCCAVEGLAEGLSAIKEQF